MSDSGNPVPAAGESSELPSLDEVPEALKSGLRNFIKSKKPGGTDNQPVAESSVLNVLKRGVDGKAGGLSLLKKAVKKAAIGKLRVASLFANILINKTEGEANEENKTNEDAVDDEEEEEIEYLASLEDINAMRTFSPLIVHRQLHACDPKDRIEPFCRTHFGAILFADISGFTRLANLLSVEQLQFHISTYFKMLFDCVERFGGDILKLCGDAIMIMWPCEEDSSKVSDVEKQAVALTACLCGRELLLSCGLYTAFHGDVEIRLTLHCGLGVADVPCYWVGKNGRWEFLITGDALRQIASTEPEAKSGEIVISPQAYELVKDHLVVRQTPLGNYLLVTSEIKKSDGPPISADNDVIMDAINIERFDRSPVPVLSDHPTLQFDLHRAIASKYLRNFARADSGSLHYMAENRKMGTGLEYYVHNSARPRLRQLGQDIQMAELREVVTLFVNITGLEEDFEEKRLDVIQKVMAALVDSHKCFGGTLRQFVVDDKGCVAIGSLGVPYHTFEDNAVRAVEIANALRRRICNMEGKNCSIGVSKGAAFCGLVGSTNRREYAMMGSCVNLAARLMCACPAGQIIVDERVKDAASSILLFESMGTVNAKGYAEPVPIFLFKQALLTPSGGMSLSGTVTSQQFVGRKIQLDSLRLGLRDFLEKTPGCSRQFHVIEGEEGIGKTALARQIVTEAQEKGMRVITAYAVDSYSKSSYWLMAQILEQIMEADEDDSKQAATRGYVTRGASSPEKDKTPIGSGEPRTPPKSPPKLSDSTKKSPFQLLNPSSTPTADGGIMSALRDALSTESSTCPRSARFKAWVLEHLAHSPNPRGGVQKTMIHGHFVMELVDLIGVVFREVIPDTNPLLRRIKRREKQLLLKTMLVRVLKLAFGVRHRALAIENLGKADVQSAMILSDFMGSAEVAFGLFTYRTADNQGIGIEDEVFATLRRSAYSVSVPNMKEREVSELVLSILGPEHKSLITRETLSHIMARTQGNPGLVEGLMISWHALLDKGIITSIADVRTSGQQSIVQKFDELGPHMQELLKIASAIGQVFSLSALMSVYRALAIRNEIQQQIQNPDIVDPTASKYLLEGNSEHSMSSMISRVDSLQTDAGKVKESEYKKILESIERLIDLGMISTAEFKEVRVQTKESLRNPLIGGFASPLTSTKFELAAIAEASTDTPEIGVHSLVWQDARGQRRRGWFAISRESKTKGQNARSERKDMKLESSPSADANKHGQRRSPSHVLVTAEDRFDEREIENVYYRFSHPSVQSTVYSLSLELDRIPVHAAIIDYLSVHYASSPGVEETCLHHASHLHEPHEILLWMMRCTCAAKETMRYSIFLQRAIQLIGFLTKNDIRSSELDKVTLQLFTNVCEKYLPQAAGIKPMFYTYEGDGRIMPDWKDFECPHNIQWLFTLGSIFSDVLFAMIRVGDFKLVTRIQKLSASILELLVVRSHLAPISEKSPDLPSNGTNGSSKSPMKLTASASFHTRALGITSDDGRAPLPLIASRSMTSAQGQKVGGGGGNGIDNFLPPIAKKTLTSRFFNGGSEIDSPTTGADRGKVSSSRSENDDDELARIAALHVRKTHKEAEDAVAEFKLPPLELMDERSLIEASYIHQYMRGQEAVVIWHILRGNAKEALELVNNLIHTLEDTCHSNPGYSVLQVICLPRLFALRSCCYPVDAKTQENRSLIRAELWLSKSKEEEINDFIEHYYDTMRPQLLGLRELHLIDNGEWVMMVVVAMRLCGEGKWEGAMEEFEAAQGELREINDRTALHQVRMLQAWAYFMMGDTTSFHTRVRAIKQYADQADESLVGEASSELLAFRFSLSCFYDAAEILLAKMKSTVELRRDSSIARVPLVSMLSRASSGQGFSTESGKSPSIYHRVAEAFFMARSRPSEVVLEELTEVCEKLSRRTPCTYLGGVYMFFAGHAALSAYEFAATEIAGGALPSSASGLVEFVQTLNEKSPEMAALDRETEKLIENLDVLTTKHVVLTYLCRALKARRLRLHGLLAEAIKVAEVDHRSPAESVTLGMAYLKMEAALSRHAGHNDSLPLEQKRENLTTAISLAKESQVLFSIFEAEIEIVNLKQCIAECEDLIRQMMPAYTAGKGGTGMTARAYWLDLSCDEDSDNEEAD